MLTAIKLFFFKKSNKNHKETNKKSQNQGHEVSKIRDL